MLSLLTSVARFLYSPSGCGWRVRWMKREEWSEECHRHEKWSTLCSTVILSQAKFRHIYCRQKPKDIKTLINSDMSCGAQCFVQLPSEQSAPQSWADTMVSWMVKVSTNNTDRFLSNLNNNQQKNLDIHEWSLRACSIHPDCFQLVCHQWLISDRSFS